MREIKIRAWDKVAKQWLWVTGIETAETSKSDGYTLEGIFHDGDFVGHEDIIVTQYTGSKDKDGKEIYEGDVLYIKEKGRWGGEYIAPVEWLEWDDRNVVGGDKGEHWAFYGIVCTTVKEISHHKDVKSLFTRGFLTRRFGTCIQLAEMTKDINRFEIKVIGNIFENQELLEDADN